MSPPENPDHISEMQRAGTLLRESLVRLGKDLRAGAAANDLRQIAEESISERGGNWSPPLESCLSLAVNDRLLGPKENRRLAEGDVITLDLSASFDGWWADCAVVLPVGQISSQTGQWIRAAREISRRSLSLVEAGVDWKLVARQTREFSEAEDLTLVDSLFGHGIGRELHESPRLSWKQRESSDPLVLSSGMTLTIEPALTPGSGELIPTEGGGWRTADGQPLFWFEETVAVTDSGCQILTQRHIPSKQRNLVLIGMPGTGKSTVGHALSERLGRTFYDLDTLIETDHGRRLEEIIHEVGLEAFLDLEAEAAITFQKAEVVLATGGSVVYRPEAMLALQQAGTIVFLHTPLEELEHRLSDLKQRGVVLEESQSLADLFDHREPLYECYHDLKIETAGHAVGETVDAIVSRLE